MSAVRQLLQESSATMLRRLNEMNSDEMKAALHSYHPSRFLAMPKGRKVMKTLNTFKITILCGFITLLVLRGTMGPGGMLAATGSSGSTPRSQRRTRPSRAC